MTIVPDEKPLALPVRDPVLMERARYLLDRPVRPGPVLYWMSRDQRAEDNWALILAAHVAFELKQPLIVLFFLHESFRLAVPDDRHYRMMIHGLRETQENLKNQNMELFPVPAPAVNSLPRLTEKLGAGLIVTDFSPLREILGDRITAAEHLSWSAHPCPLVEVDAHNVVPWHRVSDHREFAARTIRPKINRLTCRYLVDFPAVLRHPYSISDEQRKILQSFAVQDWPIVSAPDPLMPTPGSAAAKRALDQFILDRLPRYEMRNDPNQAVTSGLSPYFHFGQISPARAALAAVQSGQPDHGFLEELIVRRELSDNYCIYEPGYDRFESLPSWGLRTLAAHRLDPRSRVYPRGQLEEAQTGDPLWNAAQTELLTFGTIAGYLRMYWAKKILEWRPDPEDAFDLAITLNDRYALDGRDPNGYVGVAWSIGGLHDRPFSERPVFGQVRYMSYEGCKRKFDVHAYIHRMTPYMKKEGNG